jgi:GNAT superfamily N-acetyltransferase/2-polyprenyl-3-methyl-5-hydroxy-6-metoxy-1,4-benzoquinol methylase
MILTLENIQQHLTRCSSTFVPPLNSYVDIELYSRKLYDKAILFSKFNNNLIGLVAVYDNEIEKYGWITNVSVDPDYSGRGIATELLNRSFDFFTKKGYKNIFLEVFGNNKKAINLYIKQGFIKQEKKGDKMILKKELNKRDYNKEFKDTNDHKYSYSFDFDVMHHYMIESFKHHFVKGNCLELGSFKGDFTKRLLPYFDDVTCVEASDEAIKISKQKLKGDITYFNSLFETVSLPKKYDNIVLTHVLEHIDDAVGLLKKIKEEWLSEDGKLFLVCPNANAPSRQIAVKMGLIEHNSSITPSEVEHGHRITYSLDTLERDAKKGGLNVIYRSGIFFKALANFQWDQLLNTDIISKEYLDGCFDLGQQYPDLCSSIMLICKK